MSECALLISSVCLYSTGHWIGASVLLAILVGDLVKERWE